MWILYDLDYQVLFSKVRLLELGKLSPKDWVYCKPVTAENKQELVGKHCVSVENIGL